MDTILEWGPVARLTQQERDDLDLYAAPVGVFGLLNRCSSAPGARRLRDLIERPCLSAERIAARQACVTWLAEHHDARVRLMAAAAGLRGHDDRLDTYVRVIRTARPLHLTRTARLVRYWTLPCVIFAVVALTQMTEANWHHWAVAFFGLLAFNGVLFMQIRGALRDALDPWKDLRPTVDSFLAAAKQADQDLPADTELTHLRRCLGHVAAQHVLGSLRRWLGWVDVGGPIHVLFNLLFFYDLHVARAVLVRIVPNRNALIDAVGALADLEALNSLACFAYEQPVVCTPAFGDEPGIAIVGGLHPLIGPDQAVANDVHLTPAVRTWIVTGSNMAGKSTLLRMVGVNVLLAQIGSVATARQMTFQPCRLVTDLRIRDDLAKHESYFLAEVRQLRRMVLPMQDSPPLLGLIDEPFRGTNSHERIAADLAVIGYLINLPHHFLVATHEQRLTGLAERRGARNVHFHEDLTSARAVFDYRLRPGPATMRNALRILEREGYPSDVLQRAQDYLKSADDAEEC